MQRYPKRGWSSRTRGGIGPSRSTTIGGFAGGSGGVGGGGMGAGGLGGGVGKGGCAGSPRPGASGRTKYACATRMTITYGLHAALSE